MNAPLSFELTEDKKILVISPEVKEPFGQNALVTEELIHTLISYRADMKPERTASNPFPGTQVLSSEKMLWYVAPLEGRGVQLCLMHPGFGWVGMHLDREGALKLTKLLQNYTEGNSK